MSNIYIINCSKKFGQSEGELNNYLTTVAEEALQALGHEVKTVRIDDGYDLAAEVQNYVWADSVIYQMPTWWMSAPWTLKKYIDEVFTEGVGVLYKSDGRTRSDPGRKYGSGGLLQPRTYMLCSTWNAPLEAFEDPAQHFEGRGVDAPYYSIHKANQFIGMSPLPSFMCNDVVKEPVIADDVERYKKHLTEVFGQVR